MHYILFYENILLFQKKNVEINRNKKNKQNVSRAKQEYIKAKFIIHT